jgi:general secretion pathway protein G
VRPQARRAVKLFAILCGAALVLALFTTPYIYRPARNVDQVRHGRVVADIHALRADLETYKSRNGSYPTTSPGLAALTLAETPPDPWDTDYVYRCPGIRDTNAYDLFSAGPDKRLDTADDDWGE